jgi:cardiolipin synthase
MLRQLPNVLTGLRLLAAIPLCICIMQGADLAAFWLALIAGASDGLDGWLAKRFGWTSRLGAILDPLADKALLLAALIGLCFTGDIPIWLLGLCLGRDLCLVLGGMVYHWRYEKLTPMPSLPGKLTTLALVVLVLSALAQHAFDWPPRLLIELLVWLSGALVLLSWWHYWMLWNARSHAVRQRQSRPQDHE